MSYMTRMQEKAAALREKGHALIMAVESSCDETAIAIVQDGRKVLASQIASQIAKHAEFGGVVPEIASRMHVEALDLLADAALQEAGLTPDAIDAVAVTCGPGLVGALLTGLSWAKAYAYARDLPLVGVNHIEGHVSANYVAHEELEPPFVCLVASGGHSHISLVRDYGKHETLGRTLDDAAGEAFDKVARVLSLPYPGGPLLDKLAEEGDDSAYTFPKPRLENPLDFSFSGVKTAVIQQAHNLRQRGVEIQAANFAASFRKAVVDELVGKAVKAAKELGIKNIAAAGGVASNTLLRRELQRRGEKAGMQVYLPPRNLCTDNAAMIGSAGFYRLMQGEIASLDLNAQPNRSA